MSERSRLLELRKLLEMTQQQMAEILQIGQNAYSMIENGRVNFTDKNRSILSHQLNVNPLWLERGEGEVFTALPEEDHAENAENSGNPKGVPFYSRPIVGNLSLSLNDNAQKSPDYYISYPPFNDCSFYRPVYGESMSPRYNPADIVACQQVASRELILFGESYLCIIDTEESQFETIKILRQHVGDSSLVILKSMNENFDELTIPFDAITELYIIRGKIERNL